MSWLDQGRQDHGWFGSGTAPSEQGTENSLLAPSQAGNRIEYAAGSIIGHVPRGERGRWMSALDGYRADQLKAAFAGWFGAARERRDRFRDLLLEPGTPDSVVDDIQAAASHVVGARTQDELHHGAAALASAAKAIGPDRWARFVGDAGRRAEAAIADGLLPGVTKVAATDDAIPVISGAVIAAAGLWWLLSGSASKRNSATSHSAIETQAPSIAPATRPRESRPSGAQTPNPVPQLDSTGKVHGDLPSHVPPEWTDEQVREAKSELETSIETRQKEQIELGEHGSHRERLRQEQNLLRQLAKKLRGN